MANTKIFKSHGPSGKVPIRAVDTGDGDYIEGVAIVQEIEPYAVTLAASANVLAAPGRLHSVHIDSFSANATLKLHNGTSASDAALLNGTARVITATGILYDFGKLGIAFEALHAVIAVAACTAIFQVSAR